MRVPNLCLHPQFSKDVLVNIYSAYIDNFLNAKDAVRVAKEARPAFLKFLEVCGPGLGGWKPPSSWASLGGPGASSLGTTVLAWGVNLCPQAELEGLPWGWAPDSPFFACHSSRGRPRPFWVSAKHAREQGEAGAV